MPPAIPVLRDALGMTLVEAGFLLSIIQMAGMLLGILISAFRRTGLAAQACSSGKRSSDYPVLLGYTSATPSALLTLRATEGLGFLLIALPTPGLIRRLIPSKKMPLYPGFWGTYMGVGTAMSLLFGPVLINALGWYSLWNVLAAFSATILLWITLGVPAE